MPGIKIFEAEAFGQVRVVDVDGEPWFVARDVLRALDYAEDYNPSRAMQIIPEEWKGVHPMHTPWRRAGNAYYLRAGALLFPRTL